MKKTVSFVSIALALLVLVTLSGCDLFGLGLVGTWQDTDGYTTTYRNDGTFVIDGLITITGTFTRVNSTLTRTYTLGGLSINEQFTYAVDVNVLKLTNSDNNVSTFARVTG